jgi:hypothetical protein
MSSQNIIVPKRKRSDDPDEEQSEPLAKYPKLAALLSRAPRSEASSPSSLPIPDSRRERYMKVEFRFSPLPKYRKIEWSEFLDKVKYIVFVKAVHQMRSQAKVPPLGRFEMEAAWFQQIDAQCNKKGLVNKPGASEMNKLGLRHWMFSTAMNQVSPSR